MSKKRFILTAKEVINLEIKALRNIKKNLNNSFNQAVSEIIKCQSKVILCGVGKSGLIASKLARSYSDNHSLKTLIKEFVNIDISKQFQSSDFGGQLTPAQLKYCANDVIYLHKIHENLEKILERENRIKLYKDCLKFLKTRVDLDLALFKDDIWSH